MASVELLQYWAIIRRWLWLIVLTTLLAGVSALVVSLNMAPVYKATTQLLIQQASNPVDGATYSDILTSERLARTYAKLLTTRPVLEQALQELGLEGELDVDTLKEQVSVSPVRDTTLIQLGVEDTNPDRAILLANKIPEVFARYNESVQLSRFQESKRSLQEQLRRLEEELAQKQAQLAALKETSEADTADILRLEAQVTSLQTSYANLLRQFEEVRLAEAQSLDTIVVSEPAAEAVKVRPRTLLNTLLATIVGLMLGLGAALLIEYLDDTIKTPDDIARVADVPVLTGIAKVQVEEDLPLVAEKKPKSPVTEAFRVLRTNIQFAGVDRPVRTLVITSPGPEEGKSFVSANLAVVMAQMQKRVILVDSDLRKPTQHKIFGLENNVGLTTALLDKSSTDVSAYLQATNTPGLHVMTSGPTPPNPSELLGSQRMAELVETLLEQADVVLFDTPPVLAVTDAAILAKASDGILVVGHVGQTRVPAFYQALVELDRVGGRIVGVVLNGLPPKGSRYYSYYYYSYQHYYTYYTDGKDEETAETSLPIPFRRKHKASSSG